MCAFLKSGRGVILCVIIMVFLAAACFAIGAWPSSGDKIRTSNGLTVDYSNASDGYVIVHAAPSDSRLKLRVTCGDVTYTYDLNSEGEDEIFPLQLGRGEYKFTLYRNISGNKYSRKADVKVKVEIKDKNSAFLYPNQYVNYTEDSPAVKMSDEICRGLETDREKVDAITKYVSENYLYDYVRAVTISSGYLGDIDGCFDKKMGICQDLAALTACMLRAQGIPTKLEIGYAGNIYHAWNSVLVDGEYERLDITSRLKGLNSKQEYTVERVY